MYRGLNALVEFWENLVKSGGRYKQAAYAWSYGNPQPLQTLVDEEGCGAFFANFVENEND